MPKQRRNILDPRAELSEIDEFRGTVNRISARTATGSESYRAAARVLDALRDLDAALRAGAGVTLPKGRMGHSAPLSGAADPGD